MSARGQMGRELGGDEYWLGVKMQLAPSAVPAGYGCGAINMRFRQGVPETRGGTVRLTGMNKVTGGAVGPWGEVHGACEFQDAETKVRYHIIAADGAVYYGQPNTTAQALSLPAGETISGAVEFVQGVSQLIMLRGWSAGAPLVMGSVIRGFEVAYKVDWWAVTADPETGWFYLEAHNLAFGELVKLGGTAAPGGLELGLLYYVKPGESPDYFELMDDAGAVVEFTSAGTEVSLTVFDGTRPMPNAARGVYLQNRLFLIYGDVVYASDVLDVSRHTVYNEFRIQQGGGDSLVAVGAFGPTSLICLKEHSVARILGVYGDLSSRQQESVTGRYGCVAARSVVDVGTDLLWLSQSGVASLTLTDLNEVQAGQGAKSGTTPMFSNDIEPLIKRINWNYAAGACGAFWEGRYYLAVPLDAGEMLDYEQNPAPESSPFLTEIDLTVAPGGTYRWVKGVYDTELWDGVAIYDQSRDFVAGASGDIVIFGDGTHPISSSLRRVWKGVNNAVLVYDTVNGAWAGHDEAPGLTVQRWFKGIYNGRERLFAVTAGGWLVLYEEGFDDQVGALEPYAEVSIVSWPATGDSIGVNGGTVVVANADETTNGATRLGAKAAELATVQGRLYVDFTSWYGYYVGSQMPWSAPNTRTERCAGGVRFVATNGILPAVTLTGGCWAVTYGSRKPIECELLTRRYSRRAGELGVARWLSADVETWNGELTFKLAGPGPEEMVLASGVTQSRVAYRRPWGKADWVATNANADFDLPWRGDYSVALGGPGNPAGIYLLGEGVELGRYQANRWTQRLWGAPGPGVQLRIANARGRVRVLGARVSQGRWPEVSMRGEG